MFAELSSKTSGRELLFLRKLPGFDPACVLLIHLDGQPILERLVQRLGLGIRSQGEMEDIDHDDR